MLCIARRATNKDVARDHRDAMPNAPILLFVHGGGWIIGSRVNPPLPFVHQVATLGWVVCVIDYQLSPRVAFPEHLIDSKRAIAYLREHARKQFDANPNFIVAAGESAGGHLASLLALTSTDKSFQPGFEDVDTSVCGCIDTYGVHDFKDRNGLHFYKDKDHSFQHFVELMVMQKKLSESDVAFESASPISWLGEDKTHQLMRAIPPFLVAHGTFDTVVPCDDSRLFFEQLQSYRQRTLDHPVGGVSDVFLEIPGAHHAFNYLLSPRAFAYGQAVCAFLTNLFQKTRDSPTQCPPSRVLSDMDQQAATMPTIITVNTTAARL
ncbi:hypothetical protein BBJ28_00000090 [Nothophytophthora sp. Chile5]|nr:hypothetical protein BBJ28_00000090 [Nothophytophthora sp. Chile5]